MRVIFMGTPDFSVGTLEEIIKAGHEVALVVTQPDKPKGRGKALQCSPVKDCAVEHGIPVFQPKKIREPENVEYLRQFAPEMIIVVAFGQILSKEILDMPKYGCVNVHASLLPKYRGAAPIQWAVINGDEITGVTTMRMDTGIDTGTMTTVFFVDHFYDARMFCRQSIRDLGCTVFGSVIDENDLHLIPSGKQTVDTVFHITF